MELTWRIEYGDNHGESILTFKDIANFVKHYKNICYQCFQAIV